MLATAFARSGGIAIAAAIPITVPFPMIPIAPSVALAALRIRVPVSAIVLAAPAVATMFAAFVAAAPLAAVVPFAARALPGARRLLRRDGGRRRLISEPPALQARKHSELRSSRRCTC